MSHLGTEQPLRAAALVIHERNAPPRAHAMNLRITTLLPALALTLCVSVAADAQTTPGLSKKNEKAVKRATAEIREENREFANEKRDADEEFLEDLEKFLKRTEEADMELQKRSEKLARKDEKIDEDLAEAMADRNKDLRRANAALRYRVAEALEKFGEEVAEIEDEFDDEVEEIAEDQMAVAVKRVEAEDEYYRTLSKSERKLMKKGREYDREIAKARKEQILEQTEALRELGEDIDDDND